MRVTCVVGNAGDAVHCAVLVRLQTIAAALTYGMVWYSGGGGPTPRTLVPPHYPHPISTLT